MGRPNLCNRRVQSNSLCVGNSIAKLGGFLAVDGSGGGVKILDAELGAAQLLDGGAIGFALALGALFESFAPKSPVLLPAREKYPADIKQHQENDAGAIEERILEE